jgi:tRNA(Ile)-lysidine synthase
VNLRDHVARSLAAAGLGPDRPVAVACSGGPDSVALAHVAMTLSGEGRLGPVTLVHVDHRLRPGSEQDGQRVRALAQAGAARALVVGAEVDREKSSLERAARDARYAALDRAAEEIGAAATLLAHTASDQAETVLMRVVAGTGIRGLAGIPPRRGRYLRPLLEVARPEIEAYLCAHRLETAADPMNEDQRFFRARVRRRWLPALAGENPRVAEALCRLARAARAEREVLDYAARALTAAAALPGDPAWTALDVEAIAAAPAAVAGQALAVAAARAGGGPLAAVHRSALLDLVRRPASGTLSLDLPGLRAVREYGRLTLSARDQVEEPARRPALHLEGDDGPYEVRRWRPGDRMRPRRLGGRSRKLSDLFIDQKVPRRLRQEARVVIRVGDGAIVWAEHLGLAHDSSIRVTLTPSQLVATTDSTT